MFFFGCRNQGTDFLYRDFWESHAREGGMPCEEKGGGFYTAFSRDQPKKVYVQHKIRQMSKEVWDLLCDGAAVYWLLGGDCVGGDWRIKGGCFTVAQRLWRRLGGAHISTTLSEECTHVLIDSRMQVNEALVNAILAKKSIILTNWVKLLAEKSIRSEFPGNSQYRPSVMVEEALVDVMEPNVREACLEGFTFVLEPTDTYRFGSSFSSLLKVCGAETVDTADISSMSQDSQDGETNRMICVIPKSSGDKFGHLKHLSLLSRVKEMDLLCAILSGNLPSTSLIPPSVVISSSCSTDETVVADSDAEEEETTSSVHMIDATEKTETLAQDR
ncbi:unnamed protein product [Microthlaspi erraticum]|uniref:BRCT domain-containing protein n=1 Tax=Microthlaspi erraticum TaxID=1685480 RepID=A0A6D2JPR2_9BRAS|nr:unnamed protein product [Microthlaspi erraticum]